MNLEVRPALARPGSTRNELGGILVWRYRGGACGQTVHEGGRRVALGLGNR